MPIKKSLQEKGTGTGLSMAAAVSSAAIAAWQIDKEIVSVVAPKGLQ